MDGRLAEAQTIAPEAIAETGREPLSPGFVGGLLRLFDLSTIAVAGLAAYFFYVYPVYQYPDPITWDDQYFVAIAIPIS